MKLLKLDIKNNQEERAFDITADLWMRDSEGDEVVNTEQFSILIDTIMYVTRGGSFSTEKFARKLKYEMTDWNVEYYLWQRDNDIEVGLQTKHLTKEQLTLLEQQTSYKPD